MATIPIFGKNQNQFADCLETCYVAFNTLVLQSLYKNDPGVTLTYSVTRSVWSLRLLNGKKMKEYIFLLLLYSVIGKCSRLQPTMNSIGQDH